MEMWMLNQLSILGMKVIYLVVMCYHVFICCIQLADIFRTFSLYSWWTYSLYIFCHNVFSGLSFGLCWHHKMSWAMKYSPLFSSTCSTLLYHSYYTTSELLFSCSYISPFMRELSEINYLKSLSPIFSFLLSNLLKSAFALFNVPNHLLLKPSKSVS